MNYTFYGVPVEVIDREDREFPYPVVRIRYPSSPFTPPEWIAADALTEVPE